MQNTLATLRLWVIPIMIAIFAGVAGYSRIYLGVDFMDEAWYVSVVKNAVQGLSPFKTEFRPQLTGSLLAASEAVGVQYVRQRNDSNQFAQVGSADHWQHLDTSLRHEPHRRIQRMIRVYVRVMIAGATYSLGG